ncbi:arginine ABC transporter ATP-binding protein ArtP [Moritella sp. 24]|uniref:arginine ABC transporter ATP-binding protein ArtP n=1 Tax=Moritella sp. 24 TaxID=2746230 RepID=UPI001BAE33A9|nr:arginine ABC transporter ATP-binding protein ArtP [Moritella sp. 24]QUM78117.1 arginine ABC transporter ATP-binding protein ArtP [Moritella sp. 24]
MSIELKNICKSWGQLDVLQNIDLKCAKGETLVLLGPSGAGKSSLLRVLNLLDTPDNGSINIAGETFDFSATLSDKKLAKRSQMLRQKVGMVFQQYNLWPHMSVMDNLIEAPVKILKQTKQQAREEAMKILEQLQLADKADVFPLALSGGQQQRVAIARALMMKPEVLLFDEPTAALDPEVTNQVAEIIKSLSMTGITQVVVTHEVDFARKVASQVCYLERGEIVEFGGAEHFLQPQTPQFTNYLKH